MSLGDYRLVSGVRGANEVRGAKPILFHVVGPLGNRFVVPWACC